MVKLNLRGINVGTYKQGDFDKWELNLYKKNNDIIQILRIIFVGYYIENIMFL